MKKSILILGIVSFFTFSFNTSENIDYDNVTKKMDEGPICSRMMDNVFDAIEAQGGLPSHALVQIDIALQSSCIGLP